jgi:hypothetical protein
VQIAKYLKERLVHYCHFGPVTKLLNPNKYFMRIFEVIQDKELDEEPASRALCTSGKPDSALGASQLSSCKSQGYRSREGGKSHKVGSDRVKVRGKKIKGKKYGGPLPDWS